MSKDPNRSASWLLFCILAIAVAAAIWFWVGRFGDAGDGAGLALFNPAHAAEPSPYAGQEQRRIPALSPERVAALEQGHGLGYAKAAELNGYPGPKHVLELADELRLSDAQRAATQALFDAMAEQARSLGKELVAAELSLDREFRDRQVSAASLARAVQRAALLEGRLREAHLAAHLQQTEILDADQITRYAELRGYGSDSEHKHHHQH